LVFLLLRARSPPRFPPRSDEKDRFFPYLLFRVTDERSPLFSLRARFFSSRRKGSPRIKGEGIKVLSLSSGELTSLSTHCYYSPLPKKERAGPTPLLTPPHLNPNCRRTPPPRNSQRPGKNPPHTPPAQNPPPPQNPPKTPPLVNRPPSPLSMLLGQEELLFLLI